MLSCPLFINMSDQCHSQTPDKYLYIKEDFQKWETEDEMENLRLAFERITRLSKSSQSIILAAASQAYKEDKISGTLAEGYEVTVRPLPDSPQAEKEGEEEGC